MKFTAISPLRPTVRLIARSILTASFLMIATPVSPRSARGQREASQAVSIQVFADQSDGLLPPVWNYFGYDEPNYTYAPNGQKLLRELAALSPEPVYIRTHNLLTSGDGSASLKWGSTNAYTEDAAGNPVYDWTILDRIFDTFRATHVKPLVEIGFMPKGTLLSSRALPPQLSPRLHLHRLGLSADGLSKMG